MIMVLGSIHMTLTINVPRLPKAGESLCSAQRYLKSGGRGVALALAVRNFGVPTQLVGAVGDDDFGEPALDRLRLADVDVARVRHINGQATGLACITDVDGSTSAEVLAPGANASVRAHWISDHELASCRSLLTHGEVPVDQALALAGRARNVGCRTLLHASPWAHGAQPPRAVFDWVILDTRSLRRACAEMHIAAETTEAVDALVRLASTLNTRLLLYKAEEGVIASGPQGVCHRRAGFAPTVVYPAAAFEVFTGVFAAALNQGLSDASAIDHASVAAALTQPASCPANGAGASPRRSAIEDALLSRRHPPATQGSDRDGAGQAGQRP